MVDTSCNAMCCAMLCYVSQLSNSSRLSVGSSNGNRFQLNSAHLISSLHTEVVEECLRLYEITPTILVLVLSRIEAATTATATPAVLCLVAVVVGCRLSKGIKGL